MKKKLLLGLLMFILLCGCGGNQANKSGLAESSVEPVLNENGKVEIELAGVMFGLVQKGVIADYNAQSDTYEVVIREKGELSAEDFRRQIQLELSDGKGPDIMFHTALQGLDMRPYAEGGYLLDVTDFLTKQGELFENAVDFNRVGGRVYGVPINCTLNTMIVFQDIVTDRELWTPEYCMQVTEKSGATTFCGAPMGWSTEESGLYILNLLGVGRNGIQLFVDEEQGISNFEQKEFIEFLEFSQKYRDIYPNDATAERLVAGDIVCSTFEITDFSRFVYIDEMFQGKQSYIGYPSPEGGQHQLTVQSYYVNATSPSKEGALDFLHFLLEEEQQRNMSALGFPVRMDVLKQMWEEAKVEVFDENGGYIINGVSFETRLMTDKEEKIFWELLDTNIYYRQENPIWDIIWEDALSFYYGKKSAEEVAATIDNRVQLYLDEKK